MTNKELTQRAKIVMPGGVNSPVRAFKAVEKEPFIVKKAKGAYIYDVEGNKYVDFVSSFGPNILGNADDEVINAVKEAAENGLTYGATCENEIVLAEMITSALGADMVRFVNSGTEAVMSALRLARGYTKKDYIVKFSGCYHGHSDALLVKSGSGLLTNSLPNSDGVPEDFTKYTLVAEYNDEKSVADLFSKYNDKIAAVIVEPVAANMGVVPPKDGFLQFLREITRKNKSLLIFDEVITGFRLCYNCASFYFGIKPDITVLGKIIGGGMPVGAYAANKEIMSCIAPLGGVYQAGTLSGNPITVAAGIKTLEILKNNKDIYDNISHTAEKIANAFDEKFNGAAHANQIGSLLTFFFNPNKVGDYNSAVLSDAKTYSRFFGYMLERGFYLPPSQFEAMFISAAHSDDIINEFITAIEEYEI